MRAILIDPFTKTVNEVEYSGHLHDIYRLVGCDTIDIVRADEKHVIYVDDNGLIHDEPLPVFVWQNFHQPLAGRGLMVGMGEEGNDAAATMPVGVVQAMVSFPSLEIENITTHEHVRPDGIFVIENRPHFKRTGKD